MFNISNVPDNILNEFGNVEICVRGEDTSYSLETTCFNIFKTYILWLNSEGFISDDVVTAIDKWITLVDLQYDMKATLTNFVNDNELRIYVYIPQLIGITINTKTCKINKLKIYNRINSNEIYYHNVETMDRKDYYNDINNEYKIPENVHIPDLFYSEPYTNQYDDNGQYYFRFANKRMCHDNGSYKEEFKNRSMTCFLQGT